MLWVSNYCHCLFCCSNCPIFRLWGSCGLSMCPHRFLSTCLTSDTMHVPGSWCVFPTPHGVTVLQGVLLPLLETHTQKQTPGLQACPCPGGGRPPGVPLSRGVLASRLPKQTELGRHVDPLRLFPQLPSSPPPLPES